ncbi:MAG: helix-turn-helix domain-containing protein [Candidatus Woesearchaeota archaeon]
MIESALKEAGLTAGEIKAYLALLELGASSTGPISKKSKLSGSKVYEVLERLKGKGLVASFEKNNVMHFEALSPERLLDYLDDRKKTIDKEKASIARVLPQLLAFKKTAPQSAAKLFIGWQGIKNANEDIIMTLKKGEEWLTMGLSDQPLSWERHFTHRQTERARKGIILKHLLNEKYKRLYETRKKLPHSSYRFLPKELEMPTSTEIYANKVLIMIMVQASPLAIMIENKDVADSFRKYFEVLWKTAKP